MLKEHLKEIKGELVRHYAESCLDISKNSKGEVDYETYYEDLELYLGDIFKIDSLDDLDKFIFDTGLDERGYGLDYFIRAYSEKLVPSRKGEM